MFTPGAAVYCLRVSLIPAAGRIVSPSDRPGRWWVNVNVSGQHWPCVVDAADLVPLDADAADALGFCTTCTGFGTTADLPDPMLPSVPAPCESCAGTGRPGLRLVLPGDSNQPDGLPAPARAIL